MKLGTGTLKWEHPDKGDKQEVQMNSMACDKNNHMKLAICMHIANTISKYTKYTKFKENLEIIRVGTQNLAVHTFVLWEGWKQ